MLTAHDIMGFRKRQAAMRVAHVGTWRRTDIGRWVWALELEDEIDIWVLCSDRKGLHLFRRGSRGMVYVTEDLWGAVLQAHRASIVWALEQDLRHAVHRVDELRDALKELT